MTGEIWPEKRCTRCKEVLPVTAFSKRRKARDGLQAACKRCAAERHQENRDRRIRQIRDRSRALAARNHRLPREFLTDHPCVDCGETDLLVLEFDHIRDDKTAHVSKLVEQAYSWQRILEEIAKCEVVCANCHKRRTQRRAGSVRTQWSSNGDGLVGRPGLEPGFED